MSSEYYFRKWQLLLQHLDTLIELDSRYQEQKTNDKRLCETVQKLSGVLGGYIAIYNEALDCLEQDLQVQKTRYIADIVSAVTNRILELKQQLSKLEGSNYQFMSRGLADMKMTTDDIRFSDIPAKATRSSEIQEIYDGIFDKARDIVAKQEQEERERIEEEEEEKAKEQAERLALWGDDKEDEEEIIQETFSEETLKRRRLLNLIIAQDKTRQVIVYNIQHKLQRQRWEKILQGTDPPPARLQIRTRAAQMIQKYMRFYFTTKRKRRIKCKEEQLLGMKLCSKPSDENKIKNEQTRLIRIDKKQVYEDERLKFRDNLKVKYTKAKTPEILEDYRDEIRGWFQQWFNEIKFFCDIPKANQGGSTLILKGIIPEPKEWRELNEQLLQKMKADKNKNSTDLKMEKKLAKKEAQLQKRQEKLKQKFQEQLLKKMMKNPKMHPGFPFPKSKTMDSLSMAIQEYHKQWDDLDLYETADVKEKYNKDLEKQAICAEVKEEIRPDVDDDMRNELVKLKTSLKEDYDEMEKEWPTVAPQNYPKLIKKKKKQPKPPPIDKFSDNLLDLALKGFLKEYPQTKFEDFKGEPNFAGDDLRCNFTKAIPFGAETRNVWWERCRELALGFRKILLVGPKGGGKTVLVHAMATVNNAILFEIDVNRFIEGEAKSQELKELISSVTLCAKTAQPAVIYVRHMHRIFYSKAPPDEPKINAESLKSFLVKKLMKKFKKEDKVTFIGGVMDPWLLKSAQLLKLFPTVILLPNTTYTTTSMLLREWVQNTREVPKDLEVSCLAQVLQGYSYGYIEKALKNFLSAENIVRIAVYGLSPEDIYSFILKDEAEPRTEYENYLQWYSEKVPLGITEKKHLDAQLEFRALELKYEEKMKKANRTAQSAASSAATSIASGN